MSKIKTGGPAFPHEYKFGDGTAERADGATLRDYFAAKAMNGLMGRDWSHINNDQEKINTWAVGAYACADAMLKAREAK